VSWGFGVGSGGSSVFVDHSAENLVAADWGVDRHDEGRVVVGRVLVASLVWPVVIEVLEVLVEDGCGVVLVVDQDTVGGLGSDAAYESLGVAVRPRGVRGGIFRIWIPPLANTASNDVVNFVSRSRIKKRNWVVRSSRSAVRLRAAWVVQMAVGWAVTPSRWTRRVCTSSTNKT
jgi:hypothetical protein